MTQIFKCSYCGVDCKGLNGLALHNAMKHGQVVGQTSAGQPIDPIDHDRSSMIGQTFNKTMIEPQPLERRMDYDELNARIYQLESMLKIRQPQIQASDDFDRVLNQMTKVMMIGQLSQSLGSAKTNDALSIVKFLDGREEETEEEPENPMNFIISALASKLLGVDLSGLKLPTSQNTQNATFAKVPAGVGKASPNPQPTPVSIQKKEVENMQLLPESELLKMNDYQIAEMLKPNMKIVKSMNLSKEQAYQNVLSFYSNFPEDRFNKIWKMLNSE